jgi:hypothetical protein
MHGEWNSDPEKYRRWKGLDADLDTTLAATTGCV